MISRLSNTNTLTAYIFQTLLLNLDDITCEIDGTLENRDIEYVHRLRIGFRRLRSNLFIFQKFSSDALATSFLAFHQQTEAASKLLAQARDLDVQQVLIVNHLQNENGRLSPLTNIINRNRDTIQKQLQQLFTSTQIHEQINDFQIHINHMAENESISVLFDPHLPAKAIARCSAQAIAFLYTLHKQSAPAEIHNFRKVMRRLRYTLECFQYYFADDLTLWIEYSRKIQNELGEIHDLDMLLQSVEEHHQEYSQDFKQYHQILLEAREPHMDSFFQSCHDGTLINFLHTVLQQAHQTIPYSIGNNNYDHSAPW
jgi:CHAD domain-containing protein